MFSAGALAIGGFGRSRWLVAPDAGGLSMGFQSIFARKALPEPEFSKKAVIDGHRLQPYRPGLGLGSS
jgi:hypothetical protein